MRALWTRRYRDQTGLRAGHPERCSGPAWVKQCGHCSHQVSPAGLVCSPARQPRSCVPFTPHPTPGTEALSLSLHLGKVMSGHKLAGLQLGWVWCALWVQTPIFCIRTPFCSQLSGRARSQPQKSQCGLERQLRGVEAGEAAQRMHMGLRWCSELPAVHSCAL